MLREKAQNWKRMETNCKAGGVNILYICYVISFLADENYFKNF